jgi:hypothetical protein
MDTLFLPPSKSPLRIPKAAPAKTHTRGNVLEATVRQDAFSTNWDDTDRFEHSITPLPWRQCAPVLFLAAGGCWALLYLTIMAISRL